MKAAVTCLFAIVTVSAVPQTATAPRPVTKQEFVTAARKMESAANRVLGLKDRIWPFVADPSAPIKRSEVIATLDLMFQAYRPSFRCTPRPYPIREGHIAAHNAHAVAAQAEKLAKWGFVSPVGFLVTGPGETLTARQAGDALGVFFNQLSVCAHKPEVRWSPNIMSGG